MYLEQEFVNQDFSISGLYLLVLETMNTHFAESYWLRIFTGGSFVVGLPDVAARIFCKLFFIYIPVGIDRIPYDGEMKEICIALEQLSCFLD